MKMQTRTTTTETAAARGGLRVRTGVVLGAAALGIASFLACTSERAATGRAPGAGPSSPAGVPATQQVPRLTSETSHRLRFAAKDDLRAFYDDGVDGGDGEGLAREDFDREAYAAIVENPFQLTTQEPLSTFSIDVDTASYSNVRRFLTTGELPPAGAVRTEELVNYFPYGYEGPDGEEPVAMHVEVGACPWTPAHRLVHIGIKARDIAAEERKASNLVFLLDVSGSMNAPNKLPLLKRAMQMLVQNLDGRDRVAIVVYAGASGLVLPPTSCDYDEAILQAIERLNAGGSTNGGQGIELAYQVASESFLRGGINRVILATDGDFNVGTTDQGSLVRLIEDKARTGVFLTVLGFGMGNLQDSTLELLADKGNGHYAYVDTQLEAKKVLVEEMGATLETVAKDVKIQVEFNPLEVAGYRLLGYENRILAAQDFNDDTKDAGEMGAGHTVTALYEIVPAGAPVPAPDEVELKYQTVRQPSNAAFTDELLNLKVRYKDPDGSESRLVELPVRDSGKNFYATSDDTRFAASVAAFGMVLVGSEYKGGADLDAILSWAMDSLGDDPGGYREEFLGLVRKAKALQGG